MMSQFGARLAFRVMGIAAGAMLIVYGVVYYAWLRKTESDYRKKAAAMQLEMEMNTRNALSNNVANASNCATPESQGRRLNHIDTRVANNSNHHSTEEISNTENNHETIGVKS
ncbi:MFS_1_like domain-containing protein [Trichonephila clavipes]|nr:MFS_1_like domain-containing protein [Trichonephila clavipes]